MSVLFYKRSYPGQLVSNYAAFHQLVARIWLANSCILRGNNTRHFICKPAEKQGLHIALQKACCNMTALKPLTLLDRTSRQSRTGCLSSLAFICAVLQLICMTCLSVRGSVLRIVRTRTSAYFRAFHSLLRTRHRQACTGSQIQLTTRGAGFTIQVHCWLSPTANEQKQHHAFRSAECRGFVVDGDLGREKLSDAYAENLLKLLVNLLLQWTTLFLQDPAS